MKKRISLLLCVALLLCALAIPAAAAEEKAPVLWLRFDEVSGNVCPDAAGSNDARLAGGAKLGDGLYGNALVLNGTDAYASLPDGANTLMGGSYSISVWVKMVSNDSATHILDFGNSDSHYVYLAANYPTDNGPRWTLKDSGTKKGATGNTSLLPIGRWAHLGVTCSEGKVTLYVDGTAVQTADFTENPAQLGTLTRCWLGRSQYDVDPFLHASIDELKIFSEALSAGEMKALATPPEADPEDLTTAQNVLFVCSDVHEYNDGFRDVFGHVVNELGIKPAYALFGGDYVYHIGGNANQTEAQRAEVEAIARELSPGTGLRFYQGNHDNKGAAGLSPTGVAAFNDCYVLYGTNLDDVASNVANLRAFLAAYNDNPDYAGKPLFIESHCPLDETRRTDHAKGTAGSYISLLNEYSDKIDIIFLFGHSHTEEYENTFVSKGGTIDPENDVIGDSVTLNFTYMNMGFITDKDYAYSSGYSSAGRQHNSALKGPDYNPRSNTAGATAYELVRGNTADSAYTTQDTVFFWDVTSGCVITVENGELTIERYGYPADGTKENHPVVKLETHTVKLENGICAHDYHAETAAPTCTEEGFTTYTCSKCGDTYTGDEVPALGHDYKDGKCTRCGEADPAWKPCPSAKFTDAPKKTDWAHEGIDYCIAEGYMNGMSDTKFQPQGTVTRAQLVTILYRVKGEPAVAFKGTFTDVKAGQWYSNAIEWAAANNIVNGVGKGKFDPMGNITREQIAAILYRYSGSPAVEGNLSAFPDAKKASSYAVDALVWATGEGLVNGISSKGITTLSPQDKATRAQIASIIMRFLGGEYKCS